jgi:hypothetical protein
MLVEFTVGNFLSFKDKRTLSFEAGSISELPENVIKIGKYKLLRSAVVYGANSSGKSNLIKALDRMRDVLLNSVKLNDKDELDYSPFLLSNQSEKAPTYFEIEFIISEKKYRYGFEYNNIEIVNEWLFVKDGTKKEIALFIRTPEGIGVSDDFKEGNGKESSTNNNRLFVSLVAQLGGSISKTIIEWFRNYNVLSGIDHKDYKGFTLKMLHDKFNGCEESLSLFQKLKLGFQDINVIESEFSISDLPNNLPEKIKVKISKDLRDKTVISAKTIHNKYDKNGKVVDSVLFDTEVQESEGTKKIIDLSGPVFDTLISGKILIIDELDAKLHPLLTKQIVALFNNRKTNPKNAQLFFATHDTNLLNYDLFRRDQIWFTEKDESEQTDLYSLVEFKLPDGSKVRNDSNLEKNYIRGRYGAIPFITNS